ncbi:MAG: protein kinase [Pirellulaceae bacterium]|nr:protein kinase [Pirellulaceae bacterium]
MRIGILTDIHEAVAAAAAAIDLMREQNVDEIICLGDFCEMGTRLEETCELLLRERVQCVWGNHDFGLCEEARLGAVERYPPVVAEFAKTAVARIRIGELLFTHVEPWLDPNEITDLWYFDGVPDTAEKRARIFADRGRADQGGERQDWRIAFAGHFHTWLAAKEHESHSWDGTTHLDLSQGRHFVVIDACMAGHCAVFDTDSQLLSPLRIPGVEVDCMEDTLQGPVFSAAAKPTPLTSDQSYEAEPFATLADAIRHGSYRESLDALPDRLNHYQIIEQLGQGGSSDVWLAEHVYLKQQVAIKILRQRAATGSAEYAERFLREAQALAIMRGPGVRIVQDAAVHDNIPYVVTELLVGNDLSVHVKNYGALTINQTMDLLEQMGEVLIRQEEHGILHRDIKPNNIWVREDGSYCLFDYGLVGFDDSLQKVSLGGDLDTRTGAVMGTPVYMAPEQIRGAQADHRTDLFGLGMTAYQCLTGKSPRTFENLRSGFLEKAAIVPIPSAREDRSDITPEFERILRSLTALDPDERYASAQDFVQDLEAYRYGRRRPYGATNGSAFVAMPFKPSFNGMYEFLQDVCGEARLAARKVDRVTQMHNIWGQIESEIRSATVVIAVFTREGMSRWPNANVLTEAAHARAVGRPLIVLTTDRAEKLPFDWRHLPIIHYRNTTKGLAALREELLPRLRQELRDRANHA